MKLFKQLIKFGIVGIIATIVDFLILFIFTEYFHIYYLISSTLSFIISLIVNYILSIYWVFDVKKRNFKELILFVILSVIGLLINQIILYIGSDLLNIYYLICKIGATILVMIYNFITRKIFIEK